MIKGLMASPLTAVVEAVLLMVLLHRLNLLCYGTHHRELPSLALLVAMMSGLPLLGVEGMTLSLGVAILFVLVVEYLLRTMGQPKSPFLPFNIGFLLALPALLHPAWLLMLPPMGLLLRRLTPETRHHISGLLAGALCPLWLGLLMTAEPSLEGVRIYLTAHFGGLIAPRLPAGREWWSVVPLLLLLLVMTIYTIGVAKHALGRYRRVTMLLLQLSWLPMLLQCLYYEPATNGLQAAACSTLAATATFLTANARRPILLATSIGVPAGALVVLNIVQLI